MNLLQMAGEIADQLDIDPPSTMEGDLDQEYRRIKSDINLAYNTIKLDLGFKDESAETVTTLTTVAGQESYNFPSGLTAIHQLQTNIDPPLRIVPWTEFERYKSDSLIIEYHSFPDVAAIYGRKIYFYPIPDTAYTFNVRGKKAFAELVNDDDEPDLPDEMHRVIRELALFYSMDYENNPRAQSQHARAMQMLQLAKLNLRQHFEEPARIIRDAELRQINRIRRIVRQ